MTGNLTIENFLPIQKGKFLLDIEGIGVTELELTEINELPGNGRPDLRERPFSLIFSGPLLGPDKNLYLTHRIYRLRNETLGFVDIFIVPIGPEAGLMKYEAVFN